MISPVRIRAGAFFWLFATSSYNSVGCRNSFRLPTASLVKLTPFPSDTLEQFIILRDWTDPTQNAHAILNSRATAGCRRPSAPGVPRSSVRTNRHGLILAILPLLLLRLSRYGLWRACYTRFDELWPTERDKLRNLQHIVELGPPLVWYFGNIPYRDGVNIRAKLPTEYMYECQVWRRMLHFVFCTT